jgi:hypothetical protein
MSDIAQVIIDTTQRIARAVCKQHECVLLFGEVLAVGPLRIKVDQRYEIGEEFILLDSRCVETRIQVPQHDQASHHHRVQGTTGITVLTGLTATVGPPPASGPVTDPTGHTHPIDFDTQDALADILLWRGLQVGDKVKMLRLSMQLHYVIERVEGITNDP